MRVCCVCVCACFCNCFVFVCSSPPLFGYLMPAKGSEAEAEERNATHHKCDFCSPLCLHMPDNVIRHSAPGPLQPPPSAVRLCLKWLYDLDFDFNGNSTGRPGKIALNSPFRKCEKREAKRRRGRVQPPGTTAGPALGRTGTGGMVSHARCERCERWEGKQSQQTHWPCTGWFFIIICAAHKLFIVSDFPKKITQ